MVGYNFRLVDEQFDAASSWIIRERPAPRVVYACGWRAANNYFNDGLRIEGEIFAEADYTHFNKMSDFKVERTNSEWFDAGWFAFLSFLNRELERLFYEAYVDV